MAWGTRFFADSPFGSSYDSILIIWSDQVAVSKKSIQDTIALHQSHEGPVLTLPLAKPPVPYVEYRFSRRRQVNSYFAVS